MKKLFLTTAILAAAIGVSSLQAQASGNLSCNAEPVQFGAQSLTLKILWGQGLHGSDVTMISSPSTKMKFSSGYSPLDGDENQAAFHTQLLSSGTGQSVGEVTVTEGSDTAGGSSPVTGHLMLIEAGTPQSYHLSCFNSGAVDPDPSPTPCHGRACF